MEHWKQVKGVEKVYVSSKGRVKSSLRFPDKELARSPNHKGYLICCFGPTKERKTKAVHRLVAEAFIPNPENKTEVNHIDGDKKNNAVENLEWCTHSENIKHSFKTGLQSNKGMNNPRSKLTNDDILFIRGSDISTADLARFFSVTYATIRNVRKGLTWKAL